MNKPIVFATAAVAVAVIGYLAIMALTGPGAGGRDCRPTTAPAASEEAATENASTLGASAAASDEAFESAQEGEEPVSRTSPPHATSPPKPVPWCRRFHARGLRPDDGDERHRRSVSRKPKRTN